MEFIISALIISITYYFVKVKVPAAKARDELVRRHDELVDLLCDEEETDYPTDEICNTPRAIALRNELASIRRQLGI